MHSSPYRQPAGARLKSQHMHRILLPPLALTVRLGLYRLWFGCTPCSFSQVLLLVGGRKLPLCWAIKWVIKHSMPTKQERSYQGSRFSHVCFIAALNSLWDFQSYWSHVMPPILCCSFSTACIWASIGRTKSALLFAITAM